MYNSPIDPKTETETETETEWSVFQINRDEENCLLNEPALNELDFEWRWRPVTMCGNKNLSPKRVQARRKKNKAARKARRAGKAR